jgi:hypothetical protein
MESLIDDSDGAVGRPPVARSGTAQSARDGWALGGAALALVRHQPGLRRYAVAVFAGMLTVHVGVAAVVLHFRHEGTIPGRVIAVLATAYLVAVLSNAVAVGLAGLSDRILIREIPRAKEGWALAVRRLPQVAGWALFVVLIGIPARLLSSWGVDQVAAVLLGFGWAVISFFAIPAIALMGDGPLQAARRSLHLVRRFWVGQVAGTVYVWLRPALFIGLPGAAALLTGVVLERSGHDFLGWLLGLAGAVAVAVAYLVAVCARSVLGVAMFRFAESGSAPEGFDPARLERLMKGPTPFVARLARRLDGKRLRALRRRINPGSDTGLG